MRNTNINFIANVIRFCADVMLQRINAPQMWHLQCAGTHSVSHAYQVGNVGILSGPVGVDDSTFKQSSDWSLPTTSTVSAALTSLGSYLLRLERTELEVCANPITGRPTLARHS